MLTFCFREAIILEKDVLRNINEIQHSPVEISRDSCWSLLEICLFRLPIKKTYQLLDELYGSGEISFPEGAEFVVESIRGRSVNKGQTYYCVKWEGWPSVFNTWEPDYNLTDCKEAINNFLSNRGADVGILPSEPRSDKKTQVKEVIDRLKEAAPCSLISPFGLLQRFLELQPTSSVGPRIYREPNVCRQSVGVPTNPGRSADSLKRSASDSDFILITSKRMRQSKKDKQVLRLALQVFEQKLNSVYRNEAPITVENRIDSECPPVDFLPIPDYCPGQGVFLPDKSPVGCECSCKITVEMKDRLENPTSQEPCWENRRHHCCPATAGAVVPYNRQKRLVAAVGHPVYECNSA
ncbi:putative histone-lysine n-methyltransferase suv9 [Fasciola hepatica]|uniref:Histone-lysine n-methyltransferase suv9 n=1 Tax=Fasciola hepatica TaxID=6192 RepID=A0A4E0R6Z9_FASHE|nr:putative histone-lysine n-methyltransferase suv9 [Fasciola hepatica]